MKELAISCNNYMDTISFSPPHSRILSEEKSHQWVSIYLHGLDWERGDYPYCYLQLFIQSVVLRFPLSDFYAKFVKKTDTLQKQLEKNYKPWGFVMRQNWTFDFLSEAQFVTCIQRLSRNDRKTLCEEEVPIVLLLADSWTNDDWKRQHRLYSKSISIQI